MMKPLHALIVAIALMIGLAIVTYAATGNGSDYQRPCTGWVDELYARCAMNTPR